MRTAFINELIAQARVHPDVFLVVGDLGFSVVEPFAREFPDRFLNAGVAEQNMTGVAAGLARTGYHVFTYSIANFPTLRCLEQIRNDVCYPRARVTVVAVGGGLAYGNLGYSHHAVQDIAIMRTLPGITVLAPGDPGEAEACVRFAIEQGGPSYLRIGKAGEKRLHAIDRIDSGPICVRTGSDGIALVSTGGILDATLEAADLLEERGMSPSVFSLPKLKPVAANTFDVLEKFRAIVAIEEHVREGGLTAILRDVLDGAVRIRGLYVSEAIADVVGSQTYLRAVAAITATEIADAYETECTKR